MNNLKNFIDPFTSEGIIISCVSNYPWVYLESVNGNLIREKRKSEHGYVIGIYNFKGEVIVQDEQEVSDFIRVNI